VEGAGHLQCDHARATGGVGREGRERVEGTRRDDLPAAVAVGRGEPVLLDLREHVGLDPAHDGRHARASPSGRLGHRAAAHADEPQRVILGEHPRGGGGGELADRVPGDAGVGDRGARCEFAPREQARGHDQRLRDRGVADRVGIAHGAVLDEVDARAVGGGAEELAAARQLEPLVQKSGGL
jgi:hypothetical protein